MTISRADFVTNIRFAFNDMDTSNLVQREKMSDRPGNIFDGQNRGFFLFNRRIVSYSIYDGNNNSISGTTLTSGTGLVFFPSATFLTPPQDPNTYADYYYQHLTNDEIDQAIKLAEASGGFDSNTLAEGQLDFATLYALSYCYQAAASRSSEYYTISASGKQVSKSELFNHYSQLATTTKQNAEAMRKDHYTDRGLRDVPSAETGGSDWAVPYIQDSSE